MQNCVLRITAERGALNETKLRKLLRVRGGQVRRLLATPAENEQELLVLHLVRVSQADIKTGAARLREEPGVQDVVVSRKFIAPAAGGEASA